MVYSKCVTEMALLGATVSLSQEGFGRVRKGRGKGCHPLQDHRRWMLGIETKPFLEGDARRGVSSLEEVTVLLSERTIFILALKQWFPTPGRKPNQAHGGSDIGS
jgi:hypothetical protein